MRIYNPLKKTAISGPEMLKEVASKKIENFLGIEIRKIHTLTQDVFEKCINPSGGSDALHINGNGLKIKFSGTGSEKVKMNITNVNFDAPNAVVKKIKAFDSTVNLKGTKKYVRLENSTAKIGDIGENLEATNSKATAKTVGNDVKGFESIIKTGDIKNDLYLNSSEATTGNIGGSLDAYKSLAITGKINKTIKSIQSMIFPNSINK